MISEAAAAGIECRLQLLAYQNSDALIEARSIGEIGVSAIASAISAVADYPTGVCVGDFTMHIEDQMLTELAIHLARTACPEWYEAWFVLEITTASRLREGSLAKSSSETDPCFCSHSVTLKPSNAAVSLKFTSVQAFFRSGAETGSGSALSGFVM